MTAPVRPRPGGTEHGMVTAELAAGMPAVLLVLSLALGGLALLGQQLRCADAAAASARVAARGQPETAVIAEARRLAPSGSSVAVRRSGNRVEVTVTGPGGPGWLGDLSPRGRAAFSVEEPEP